MGFDLDAFLGKASEQTKWKKQLPGAVVCELGGDLERDLSLSAAEKLVKYFGLVLAKTTGKGK
jgi:hypothetical protein